MVHVFSINRREPQHDRDKLIDGIISNKGLKTGDGGTSIHGWLCVKFISHPSERYSVDFHI